MVLKLFSFFRIIRDRVRGLDRQRLGTYLTLPRWVLFVAWIMQIPVSEHVLQGAGPISEIF